MSTERSSGPRTVVVTGAGSGVGRHVALYLAAQGMRVVVLDDDPVQARRVARDVGGIPIDMDSGRLGSVRQAAAGILDVTAKISVLIHAAAPRSSERLLTADGHDENWQRNFLAPFLLTGSLLPRMVATAENGARVIWTVGSRARPRLLRLDDLDWVSRPSARASHTFVAARTATSFVHLELCRRLMGTGVDSVTFSPNRGGPGAWLPFLGGSQPEAVAADLQLLAGKDGPALLQGAHVTGASPSLYPGLPKDVRATARALWEAATAIVGLV